jgi:hypothetical protein
MKYIPTILEDPMDNQTQNEYLFERALNLACEKLAQMLPNSIAAADWKATFLSQAEDAEIIKAK